MEISIIRQKLSDKSYVFNVGYSDEHGTKLTFGMISEEAAANLAAALADCAWITVD